MTYVELPVDGIVAAGATTLTLTIGPAPPTRTWLVSQVSVEMAAAPSGATCELRKTGRLVTLLIATGDVAGGDPPVLLRGGESLTVQWAGVTAGLVGRALAIMDERAGR